jgi:DNA-binding transcriptional LysR family regulator
MTFQQLNYLLEVNRTGSFTVAAKNLFVAQSTVSNAITALENEIGSPIFIRGKKGLYPTPRGEDIIAHAGRICDSYRFMTSGETVTKRSLRICCDTYTPANTAFLRLLEENQADDVDYSFVNHNYLNAFHALLNYEIDISLHMVFAPNATAFEEKVKQYGLDYQIIATIPVAACIGPGHRLYAQENISMQDFKDDKLLELPSRNHSNAENLGAYIPVNKNKLLIASGTVLRERLLEKGYVYSLRALPSIERRNIKKMRYIPVPGLSYKIYALTDKIHPLTRDGQRYLTLLKEEIAKEIY